MKWFGLKKLPLPKGPNVSENRFKRGFWKSKKPFYKRFVSTN
jgi:hypothetical protein